MRKCPWIGAVTAGLAAGTVTGLFGGGGGIVLVPLLMLLCDLPQESIFPASIATVFPICLAVLAVTAFTGTLDISASIPYLLGSTAGGFLAGKWGQKIPVTWLHRGLGLFIFWGGIRYLC